MRVGWEYVAWSRKVHRCNVESCRKKITSGYARVDNADPYADGFTAICLSCWAHIQAGLDPDPNAKTPEWEVENRNARLLEALTREQ